MTARRAEGIWNLRAHTQYTYAHTHTEERVSVQPLRLPARMHAAAPSLVPLIVFFPLFFFIL